MQVKQEKAKSCSGQNKKFATADEVVLSPKGLQVVMMGTKETGNKAELVKLRGM